jgi:hypothetical protein
MVVVKRLCNVDDLWEVDDCSESHPKFASAAAPRNWEARQQLYVYRQLLTFPVEVAIMIFSIQAINGHSFSLVPTRLVDYDSVSTDPPVFS